jgi:hypothetical protein
MVDRLRLRLDGDRLVSELADGAGPAYSPAPEGALAELAEDALGTLAATSDARDLAART